MKNNKTTFSLIKKTTNIKKDKIKTLEKQKN